MNVRGDFLKFPHSTNTTALICKSRKEKKKIIFCIDTLNEKVTPLLIFWFSQWKKLLMMQIQQVDLKLSKDN